MAQAPKRDLTVPGIIAALILVIVLANVVKLPGCNSKQLAKLPPEAKTPAVPPAVAAAQARSRYAIAMNADGSPWYTRPVLAVTSQYIRDERVFAEELRLATDGNRLRAVILAHEPDPRSLIPSTDITAPWEGDSIDLFFSTEKTGAPVTRLTVDYQGHARLARYPSPSFGLAAPGETIEMKNPQSVVAAPSSCGYEITLDLPLDELGLKSLKPNDVFFVQMHRYQHGLASGVLVRSLSPELPSAKRLAIFSSESMRKLEGVMIVNQVLQKHPLREDLPKTMQPTIVYSDDLDAPGVAFPQLRGSDGKPFTAESTTITMVTDGHTLHVKALCSDKNPEKMITSFSSPTATDNFMPFKDDSMEFFFAVPGGDWYYQVVASNTGAWRLYRYRYVLGDELAYRPWQAPSVDVKVTRENGFTIDFSVDLKDMEMSDLKPGDSLTLQIVRNYRGQFDPSSTLLHLFPTVIYANADRALNNHDRAAFQPATVQRLE